MIEFGLEQEKSVLHNCMFNNIDTCFISYVYALNRFIVGGDN